MSEIVVFISFFFYFQFVQLDNVKFSTRSTKFTAHTYFYGQFHTFYYRAYLTRLYRLLYGKLAGLAAVHASSLSKDFNTPCYPRQWSREKGYSQLIKGFANHLKFN